MTHDVGERNRAMRERETEEMAETLFQEIGQREREATVPISNQMFESESRLPLHDPEFVHTDGPRHWDHLIMQMSRIGKGRNPDTEGVRVVAF
jgi:hypothetical protein